MSSTPTALRWTERGRPSGVPAQCVINIWAARTTSADRAAAEQVIATFPDVLVSVRAQRAFLARAAKYLVTEAGIRQFLDIGTGLPASNNTHEVAQQVCSEYVPKCAVRMVAPLVRACLGKACNCSLSGAGHISRLDGRSFFTGTDSYGEQAVKLTWQRGSDPAFGQVNGPSGIRGIGGFMIRRSGSLTRCANQGE